MTQHRHLMQAQLTDQLAEASCIRPSTLQPHNSPILGADSENRVARNSDQNGSATPTRFIIDTQPVSYRGPPQTPGVPGALAAALFRYDSGA